MDSKTRYFSPDNIEENSLAMLKHLPEARHKRNSIYIPEKSALLILDMQSYFLDSASHAYVPSAETIVPGIKALAQAFYMNDLPVVFTQHLNTRQDAGSMATWWQDFISIENPLSAIIPELDFSNRYVLRKNQYDAFYQTPLEDVLRRKGVTQVVISGVMTHLCCETTARSAFMRGFEIYFLVDGTATYNEDYHMATLLNLSHGFARPVLADEIQSALDNLSET